MKSSFERTKKGEDREEYEEVFGVNARPLLEKFIEFLHELKDGWEAVEIGKWFLIDLIDYVMLDPKLATNFISCFKTGRFYA